MAIETGEIIAEKQHQHSASCGHDDHEQHEHHGACNHDHHEHHEHHHDGACNHDHDNHHRESLIGTRLAETGGNAAQLELGVLIPGETDELGRFEKLEELLEARTGISDVHVRRDGGGAAEICIHYDHNQINLEQLVALVKSTGADVSKRYRQQTWFAHGLESAQNGYALEEAVRKMPGVLTANAAYAAERFVAEYDSQTTNPKAIAAAVKKLGFELEEPEHGHVCAHHPGKGGFGANWQMPLVYTAGALIAVGWILRMLLPVPEIAPTIFFALAVAAGGFFPVRGALASLRQNVFDIETLMVLAGVGACFLGAWFEGAFLLFLFSLGHALEHRAMEKARKELEALGKLRPEKARVKRGGDTIEMRVEQVRRGDIIVIRPGDRVALDGVIRSGASSLDQSTITGESIPIAKIVGESVFAGTINHEAALEVEVTKLSTESVISRVVEMVTEAEARKSPTQRFAKKLERIFVPIVLIAAPLLTLVLYFGQDLNLRDSVLRGISLLVAASPCALAIATPAAVLSAVARAAKGGVLIKGGAHLETLGNVKTIAFDKTGTLTIGKPRVVAVAPFENVSETELLAIAAAAESKSSHPLASAVVNDAKRRGIAIKSPESAKAVHGKGLHSTIAGKTVSVGNLALFAGENVPESIVLKTKELEAAGQTTMIVRRDNQFLGVIGVADALRPEAKKALAELNRIGIRRTIMLSGDNQIVADVIAKEVGINEAVASLLPEGKVEQLKKLAAEGGVGMVGDGVNDAPALAAASVGIAMGGTGSDVALETADLVLMSESLERLPFAVELSRAANRVIKQNLVIALGVSAVLIVATIFGWVAITEAVILHEGSTLLVVFNGLRLLLFRN